MKLSVIVPVYNEEATIKILLERLDEIDVEKEIIIINDSSVDASDAIIQQEMKKYKNVVYKNHRTNQGKGAAIQTAQPLTKGDYVIIQDGDLEYSPQDYYQMIRAIEGKQKVVVYGSRFLNRQTNISKLNRWANAFLTFTSNTLFGIKLTDMETCYKLIPGNLFRSLEIESNRFDFEVEITAKITEKGYKIIEVPIEYDARNKEAGKKIGWGDGFQAIWKLLKYSIL